MLQQPRKKDNSTDIATLHIDVPAQYVNILDTLQLRLRGMLGMHEVTIGRPTGPFARLSLKGTQHVLREAQERLECSLNLNLCGIGTTRKATPAHRPQQLEAPTATVYIPAQPPLTPSLSPRT